VQKQKDPTYILSPLFPTGAKQALFFFTTPILRIQLTSAFDKNADNCSLPTAVIYNRSGIVLGSFLYGVYDMKYEGFRNKYWHLTTRKIPFIYD